eukprot:scaffold5297_cov108-Skeletonema_marinoi.AAC.8
MSIAAAASSHSHAHADAGNSLALAYRSYHPNPPHEYLLSSTLYHHRSYTMSKFYFNKVGNQFYITPKVNLDLHDSARTA